MPGGLVKEVMLWCLGVGYGDEGGASGGDCAGDGGKSFFVRLYHFLLVYFLSMFVFIIFYRYYYFFL